MISVMLFTSSFNSNHTEFLDKTEALTWCSKTMNGWRLLQILLISWLYLRKIQELHQYFWRNQIKRQFSANLQNTAELAFLSLHRHNRTKPANLAVSLKSMTLRSHNAKARNAAVRAHLKTSMNTWCTVQTDLHFPAAGLYANLR